MCGSTASTLQAEHRITLLFSGCGPASLSLNFTRRSSEAGRAETRGSAEGFRNHAGGSRYAHTNWEEKERGAKLVTVPRGAKIRVVTVPVSDGNQYNKSMVRCESG